MTPDDLVYFHRGDSAWSLGEQQSGKLAAVTAEKPQKSLGNIQQTAELLRREYTEKSFYQWNW